MGRWTQEQEEILIKNYKLYTSKELAIKLGKTETSINGKRMQLGLLKVNIKRRTYEEFIEELRIQNPNVEIIGEYINTKNKIKCKCLIDGHIWDKIPSDLLRGQGCPKCANKKRTLKTKTHEQFIKELKIKNPNLEILGEYINCKTSIKCKCLIDGHIWEAVPYKLLFNGKCPKCSGYTKTVNNKTYNTKRKPHEQFIEEIKKKNPNIKILDKYINNKTKVQCECLIDGYTWKATPSNLLIRTGCPECGMNYNRKKTKTHEQFVEEIKKKSPNTKIIGKYVNSRTKIKCECLIDGHIWNAAPSNLLAGCGCPKCKSSKGEILIENYCKNNYLKYISQYRIDNCKYKSTLPFDFALFNKNKLVAIIEYQGRQHYEPVDFAGKGEEWAINNLKEIKKRDQVKRDYCLDNGISLIEIPYWMKDVESYLEEQMDKIINKPMQLSLV